MIEYALAWNTLSNRCPNTDGRALLQRTGKLDSINLVPSSPSVHLTYWSLKCSSIVFGGVRSYKSVQNRSRLQGTSICIMASLSWFLFSLIKDPQARVYRQLLMLSPHAVGAGRNTKWSQVYLVLWSKAESASHGWWQSEVPLMNASDWKPFFLAHY